MKSGPSPIPHPDAPQRDAYKPPSAPQQRAREAPLYAMGNLALQSFLSRGLLRPKLSVGSPADPAEAQADRMADAAMSGKPAGCSCGAGEPPCPSCQAATGTTIRRKPRATPNAIC